MDEQGRGATTGGGAQESVKPKRKRAPRSFPAMPFEDALKWAEDVLRFGSGQAVRRLSLLEHLSKSPSSSAVRQIITSSNQYGLTTGGYNAEMLELTANGIKAVDPSGTPRARVEARATLAVFDIAPFNAIFQQYSGNRLPATQALQDAAAQAGVDSEHLVEAVDTFLSNARFVGLIRQIAGDEHLVRLDDALDHLPVITDINQPQAEELSPLTPPRVATAQSLDDVCFVVSPIGDDGSVERKHADLVLNHLIMPAIEPLGLRAVRADQVSQPGMITSQVMEHLARAKLVIADLSFANPNVYYELAVRHASRKPAVQICRKGESLPFDVGQFRTVVIDMSDIYTLIPALRLHVSEISTQARSALNQEDEADSPISKFYPKFWKEIDLSK